jgi:hypothetical protein
VDRGTYHLASQISITNAITLESVYGATETVLDGGGAVRCLNLANSACVVRGFVITNGFASGNGGGVLCTDTTPIIENCILAGNRSSSQGGGACSGTLRGCRVVGNVANEGGGTYLSRTENCTVTDNQATSSGGGMAGGEADNCVVWHNTGGDLASGVWKNTCSPDATHGADGNITNAPLFADAGGGDHHLMPNSPCINAGDNRFVQLNEDLDGNARIFDYLADMGAYEYQRFLDRDDDGLSDGFELYYFGDETSAVPADDPDGDGYDNLAEHIGCSSPFDSSSVFSVMDVGVDENGRFAVYWDSMPGRIYDIYWKSNLFISAELLENGISYPTNSYIDTIHSSKNQGFYEVKTRLAE